jgi:hypothetical protein
MVSYSTLQQALASNAAITCRCGLIVRTDNRFRTVKFDNNTMSICTGGDIDEAWIIGTNPEAHDRRLTFTATVSRASRTDSTAPATFNCSISATIESRRFPEIFLSYRISKSST